jgi:hypothetical protein
MDPRISVFDDNQERTWSGFWQIMYTLQMFGININDFTNRSDHDFQELITEARRRDKELGGVGEILDAQIGSLAELLGTQAKLSSLRQGVAKYIASVPKRLGCFDMNLLYGPYVDETLPANLSQITRSHLAGCPTCAKLVLELQL